MNDPLTPPERLAWEDALYDRPHDTKVLVATIARLCALNETLAELAASWKHEQGGTLRKFCLMLKEQRLDPAIEMHHGCEAYRGPTCDACRAMDDAADELLAAMEEKP